MAQGDNGCSDDLLLEQWLDGELAAVPAELLYVHLETCASCRQRLDELNSAKRLCEERLGLEDEGLSAETRAALARVRLAIHQQSHGRVKTPVRWWRPLALVAAAVLVVVVIRLGVWESPIEASGERIIAAAALREQSWVWEPFHVRRRVLAVDVVGSAAFPDGRYRIVTWQWNSPDGVATISKRFDQANRLLAAHWRDATGREVDFVLDRPVAFELTPSTADLRAEAGRLTPAQQRALEAFVERRETLADPTEQRRFFENWFTRNTAQGARGATAQRFESSRWGDVYYIRTDERFEPGPAGITRIVAENYISAADLMRRRLRVTREITGGRTETQDTHWLSYDDTTRAEFEANTLGALMAGREFRRWTAADVANREIEAHARRLVPKRAEGT